MSKLKKALEKAKDARQRSDVARDDAGPSQLETMTFGGHEPAGQNSVQAGLMHRYGQESVDVPSPVNLGEEEAVRPQYRQTRIVDCDPETLKKNKLVSLVQMDQVADQVKILRSQILDRMKETGGNSLMITSANPGEGKTLTAINLAVSVSQEVNRTTLLVDADLRKPSVHSFFGLPTNKGLVDYLLGDVELKDILVNPGLDKLTVLPAGRAFPNSTELLGSPRMAKLIHELKGKYQDRFIIFDTTSLLTRADPVVFADYVDGILLVVEAERTSAKQLKRALELLRDRPVIGTMFNKARGMQI